MKLKQLWVRLAAPQVKFCGAKNSSARAPTAAVTLAPWAPIRDGTGRLRGVRHTGEAPARQVRVLLAGDGVFAQSLPVQLHPGERLLFRVGAAAHAEQQTVVVRWLDSAGRELLWSVPVC